MQKYRTILMDVDGTLLDFNTTEQNALKKTFENNNYLFDDKVKEVYDEINHELWRQYEKGIVSKEEVVYTRFVKLFKIVGIDGDGIAFEDEYQELLGQGHELITGAIEILEKLHNTHELYVVTNGITKTQLSRLKASKIDRYMRGIFVSEATGFQKPMKEYFEYCFERIPNLDLKRTIIIGDSLSSDMRGGNNVGIDTCWYNPNDLPCDMDVKIDYVVKELAELYNIVN